MSDVRALLAAQLDEASGQAAKQALAQAEQTMDELRKEASASG